MKGAIHSSGGLTRELSKGRRYHEAPCWPADPWEVDRRRIFHSSAFRRLQHKTQVFLTHQSDHFRTRMTHTLEVANVGRVLARLLQVNEPLTEVIALAHDLGHAPFGHAGEKSLSVVMSDHGGFEHNEQSLRVVEYLEHPFPPFRGLNLSYEVLEALVKHRTSYDRPRAIQSDDPILGALMEKGPQPTLEGQIASVADRIAYNCHDMEDALGAGLIEEADLQEMPLWQQWGVPLREAHREHSLFAIWREFLERLQRGLMEDVVEASRARMLALDVHSPDAARSQDCPVIGFSESLQPHVHALEHFLFQKVYSHVRVQEMDTKAMRMIQEVCGAYLEQPQRLPTRYRARIEVMGVHRVVCDYVAGMTDRYCEREYRQIFMPFA